MMSSSRVAPLIAVAARPAPALGATTTSRDAAATSASAKPHHAASEPRPESSLAHGSDGPPTPMPTGAERSTSGRGLGRERSFAPMATGGVPVDELCAGYGSIRFPGSSMPLAKWVRIPCTWPADGAERVPLMTTHAGMSERPVLGLDGRPKTTPLIRLFTEAWGVKPPSALVSILGPRTELSEDALGSIPEAIFKRALVRMAKTSRAWVFTNGVMTDEVVSLVGRALEGSEVPTIGFAPWGLVAEATGEVGADTLRSHDAGQIHYYRTGKHTSVAGGGAYGTGHESGDKLLLDPCHTHFVLADELSQHTSGATAAHHGTANLYTANCPLLECLFDAVVYVLHPSRDDRCPMMTI